MKTDYSDHDRYWCRHCRWECIQPEDSEEALRRLCTDCLRLGKTIELEPRPSSYALLD